MRAGLIVWLFVLAFKVCMFIGWILSIYKAVTCNWEPVGKAEVIYTVGAVTPLGGVIGWLDIEDK